MTTDSHPCGPVRTRSERAVGQLRRLPRRPARTGAPGSGARISRVIRPPGSPPAGAGACGLGRREPQRPGDRVVLKGRNEVGIDAGDGVEQRDGLLVQPCQVGGQAGGLLPLHQAPDVGVDQLVGVLARLPRSSLVLLSAHHGWAPARFPGRDVGVAHARRTAAAPSSPFLAVLAHGRVGDAQFVADLGQRAAPS